MAHRFQFKWKDAAEGVTYLSGVPAMRDPNNPTGPPIPGHRQIKVEFHQCVYGTNDADIARGLRESALCRVKRRIVEIGGPPAEDFPEQGQYSGAPLRGDKDLKAVQDVVARFPAAPMFASPDIDRGAFRAPEPEPLLTGWKAHATPKGG